MEAAKEYQCRLCMGYDSFQLNIFHEDLHHKQILMKLRTCLPVKVDREDGLPTSICYKCLSQLENSFELWNKSFNSEAILRHNLIRGRVHPNFKNTSSIQSSDTGFSNLENDSFDHDTYFIETKEPHKGDLMESENLEKIISENVLPMSGKPRCPEYHENPYSRYMRQSSLSKEIPKSTNKVNSEHDMVKYNNNSEKKTYSATNQPKLKETELDSVEKSQKEQKNYFRGAATFWVDNEEFEFADETGNMKNKYINKNLFGDNAVQMFDKLMKPQRNCKRRGDQKGDTNHKSKSKFPWEKNHKPCEEEIMTSPRSGSSMENYPRSKRKSASITKETHNSNGTPFDPNLCPKCNMTLTPSQNLLAHFQSHIQDE